MTCILGMEHNGKVYIGGDSITMNGWDRNILSGRKVFRRGDFLIGYSGAVRMQNILQYQVKLQNAQVEGQSDEEYIVTELIVSIREVMKGNGYLTSEESRETAGNNAFLAGYHGKLYWIGSDFDVSRFASGMGAVGSGADYALGALEAQRMISRHNSLDVEPETFITRALIISAEYCATVAPPFYVEVI